MDLKEQKYVQNVSGTFRSSKGRIINMKLDPRAKYGWLWVIFENENGVFKEEFSLNTNYRSNITQKLIDLINQADSDEEGTDLIRRKIKALLPEDEIKEFIKKYM